MLWSDCYPILNRKPRFDRAPTFERQSSIPKIIHQIYFSDKLMPAEMSDYINHLKLQNPGWEHRLYDEPAMADLIKSYYGGFVDRQYRRLNPAYGAALADFFRYAVLYKDGGLYLDIKSIARRPLDIVLRPDDQFLLSQWNNQRGARYQGWGCHPEVQHIKSGEFLQWYIASSPGHPFLKAVIENMIRNIDVYNPGLHGTGQLGVLRVTGPIAYSLAIAPVLERYPYRLVDAHEDLGLSYSIYGNDAHGSIFRDHYSRLTEPVVHLSRLKTVTAFGFNAARSLWRAAKRLGART